MNRRAVLATATSLCATLCTGSALADPLVVNAPGAGELNLRTGPGTGFPIVYVMPHGSEVHTLEWSGRWVKVRHASGHTGWCASAYLARARS